MGIGVKKLREIKEEKWVVAGGYRKRQIKNRERLQFAIRMDVLCIYNKKNRIQQLYIKVDEKRKRKRKNFIKYKERKE